MRRRKSRLVPDSGLPRFPAIAIVGNVSAPRAKAIADAINKTLKKKGAHAG